jgi:hypothetical protein
VKLVQKLLAVWLFPGRTQPASASTLVCLCMLCHAYLCIRWQYTGRAGFPPAPSQLSGYGVKDRLSSRWQEVQQVGCQHAVYPRVCAHITRFISTDTGGMLLQDHITAVLHSPEHPISRVE